MVILLRFPGGYPRIYTGSDFWGSVTCLVTMTGVSSGNSERPGPSRGEADLVQPSPVWRLGRGLPAQPPPGPERGGPWRPRARL
jgi:hypothetical protein